MKKFFWRGLEKFSKIYLTVWSVRYKFYSDKNYLQNHYLFKFSFKSKWVNSISLCKLLLTMTQTYSNFRHDVRDTRIKLFAYFTSIWVELETNFGPLFEFEYWDTKHFSKSKDHSNYSPIFSWVYLNNPACYSKLILTSLVFSPFQKFLSGFEFTSRLTHRLTTASSGTSSPSTSWSATTPCWQDFLKMSLKNWSWGKSGL